MRSEKITLLREKKTKRENLAVSKLQISNKKALWKLHITPTPIYLYLLVTE